jgi:hypothetical protein
MTTVDDALGRPDPAVARRARRVAVHTFRPRRSWPALLAAVLVLAVAAVAAAEVISALVGTPLRLPVTGPAVDYAASTRWSDPTVQAASAVLAVIGLALIGLAVVPGRGRWTVLRTDDPGLVVGLSRPALRRTLAAAAHRVSGVRGARVAVQGRRVRVRVRTDLREPAPLREEVAAAVRERVAELAPLYDLKVSTRVRNAKA